MTLFAALLSSLVLQSIDICAEPMAGGVGEPDFCALSKSTTIKTPYFSFTAAAKSFVGIDRDGNRAIVQPTVFKNLIQLSIETHPLSEKAELMRRFGRCGDLAAQTDSLVECNQSTNGIVQISRLYLGAERLIFAKLSAGEMATEQLPEYRVMLESIAAE